MIEFIGKTLLLDKKVLVIGDLHLGYNEALWKSGFMIPTKIYETIVVELENVLKHVDFVDTIVILGDLKHAIGTILWEERQEITKLLTICGKRAKKVVIVKGNHDALLEPLVRELSVTLVDYFVWEDYIFMHGDRDFPALYNDSVKTWVLGHFHPALTFTEGSKIEKYKCFLQGTYKKKKIIIVPSFFPGSEGSDVREQPVRNPWNFAFGKFKAIVVSDDGQALDFGPLERI